MRNVFPAARMGLSVLVFLVGVASVRGQAPYYPGKGRVNGYPDFDMEMRRLDAYFPEPPKPAPARPATVSMEILRHPPSAKGRRLLEKALRLANLGNHLAAIQGLQEALAKEPTAAPYAHNLLGIEYLKMKQVAKAKDCFEEAARLMPHESLNHSNLGLSLALVGEWESAEKEERAALELDHANFRASSILAFITSWRETHREKSSSQAGALYADGIQ